jgi:hypothetical protein
MQKIIAKQFESLLEQAHIKPRLRRELRFTPGTYMGWDDLEFIGITDRNGDRGVLLIEPYKQLFVVPYELSRRITDRQTGRTKPIICDICYTWQAGSNAGRITFLRPADAHTITFLCCADLDCCNHVRNKTKAASLSRAQLHEDLTTEQRIERLKARLQQLASDLGLMPLLVNQGNES